MSSFAPVVVFAYARKEHLEKALNSLNKSALAKKTELFIFCDNFKSEKDKQQVEETRKFVDSFSGYSNFSKTTIVKADANRGLKDSVVAGVTSIINEYGRVIVVEDDLEVSPFFLEFMNNSLDFYESNNQIWAISGYTLQMKSLKKYEHDVYFAGRGCSWGWATWKDRWSTIDWSVLSYKSFKHNWKKRKGFSKWGADLPPMLDYQMASNINSWAIIWCYEAFKQNKITVYPKESYVKNLGNDGSGSHGSQSSQFDSSLNTQKSFSCVFQEPFFEKNIKKEFHKIYSGNFVFRLKDQVKSFLIRNNIWKKK